MTVVGCVHGRFQPFHNGHLEYVSGAFRKANFLYIGITNFRLAESDPGSPDHRYVKEDNPFTYWQRAELIRATLTAEGVDRDRYLIVPFPIVEPSEIENFVPKNAVMFTTIYERWNIEKIRRIRQYGYAVCILWRRRTKLYEGRKVREIMRSNLNQLDMQMHPSAVPLLKRFLGHK